MNTVREMWPEGSEELHAHVSKLRLQIGYYLFALHQRALLSAAVVVNQVETDATGAACYPLVSTHPVTGRKAIVASATAVATLSETMAGEGSLGACLYHIDSLGRDA